MKVNVPTTNPLKKLTEPTLVTIRFKNSIATKAATAVYMYIVGSDSISLGDFPIKRSQVFPKSGPYHRVPSAMDTTVPTITASQLTEVKENIIDLLRRIRIDYI